MAGPDGTPAQWHAFGEFLRRALHAIADQVEPRSDGLEVIRARIPAGPAGPLGPGLRDRRTALRRRRRGGVRS
jgi:hypothetical protein